MTRLWRDFCLARREALASMEPCERVIGHAMEAIWIACVAAMMVAAVVDVIKAIA